MWDGDRKGVGMRRELRAEGEGTMLKDPYLLGLQILNFVVKFKGCKERQKLRFYCQLPIFLCRNGPAVPALGRAQYQIILSAFKKYIKGSQNSFVNLLDKMSYSGFYFQTSCLFLMPAEWSKKLCFHSFGRKWYIFSEDSESCHPTALMETSNSPNSTVIQQPPNWVLQNISCS